MQEFNYIHMPKQRRVDSKAEDVLFQVKLQSSKMQKNTLIGSVQLTKLNQLVTLKTTTARGCLFYFFIILLKYLRSFLFCLIMMIGRLFRKRILQIGENINEKIVINGNRPLKGEVISGANSALLIPAAILADSPDFRWRSDIQDVHSLIEILEIMGAKITFENNTLIDPTEVVLANAKRKNQ